jgi:hypothetical protein
MVYLALSFAALLSAQLVSAQADPAVKTPLADKRFNYTDLPYKVDTDQGTIRGPQLGYNLCNSTTEGPNSLCQTMMVNHADDFCLWAPSTPGQSIADTEGVEVAWCTRAGRGTRIIPQGAITGLQFMKTPAYVQVVGFIDQTKIDIGAGDAGGGGELDPHGADGRGNPLGGIMFSNAFPSNGGDNDTYQQVIEWHNFMGGNAFCIKACDQTNPDAAKYCQHIYDRIGCNYNAPNDAQNGQFLSCEGDVQDFPGIYTQNGQIMTYTQPPESLGPIETLPYQPRVPASSNCITYQSAELLASIPPAGSTSTTLSSATATASASGMQTTATGASRTGTPSTPSATGHSGASALKVPGVVTMLGFVIALGVSI